MKGARERNSKVIVTLDGRVLVLVGEPVYQSFTERETHVIVQLAGVINGEKLLTGQIVNIKR